MKRLARVAARLALAFGLTGMSARSADTDLLEILSAPIVTAASRTAETASTAPATSTNISSEELRRYGLHTLEEAVNFLALGVSSAGGPSISSLADLGARGVAVANDGGSHFLLLLDGHTLNDPYSGTIPLDYRIGVPLEVVDHIEVIVGPGSVLYGSNAMLGVINIVTKTRTNLGGGHLVLEAEVPVGYRGAAFGSTSIDILGEHLELTLAGQYVNQYGPDFRLGPQYIGIDPVSGRLARTTRGGEETGIWGGVARESTFNRRGDTWLRARLGNLEAAVRVGLGKYGQPFLPHDFDDAGSAIVERYLSLDVKYPLQLTPQLVLVTRVYADGGDSRQIWRSSDAFSCFHQGVTTCEYEVIGVGRWAGLELQSGYDWLGDGRLRTLVGVEGRLRSVGSKVDVSDLDTGAYLSDSTGVVDVNDHTLGAYVQQLWWLLPEVALNAGVRLDRDPRFPAVASPRGAMSIALWPGATLRSIYSEAFRAPNFFQSDYGDGLLARASGLKPETVRAVEGSIEQRFGAHRISFGVFQSRWRDLIQEQFISFDEAEAAAANGLLPFASPDASYSQFRNTASIENYGFNTLIEGGFASPSLRYGVLFSEAYSRQTESDSRSELLPTAPRFKANGHVALDLIDPLPTLAVSGYLLSQRLVDRGSNAGFRPVPFAPTQLGLRGTATGRIPFIQGLSYRLSADTVFGNRGPYAIGWITQGTPDRPSPELSPVAPFRLSVGLEYGFGEE